MKKNQKIKKRSSVSTHADAAPLPFQANTPFFVTVYRIDNFINNNLMPNIILCKQIKQNMALNNSSALYLWGINKTGEVDA